MSFFMRSSSAEMPSPQELNAEMEDDKSDCADAYNDLLLDQDNEDFLSRDTEFKATSTQATNSPNKASKDALADHPSKIPNSKDTEMNENAEDGDLEITGVQETEKLPELKRTLPTTFTSTSNVQGRSMTTRPPIKVRKTGTQPSATNLELFPQTDKSLEPLFTAISNLQREKKHLQSELNSYMKKYDLTVSKLKISTSSLTELKGRVDLFRGVQQQLEKDVSKLHEGQTNYKDQIKDLQAEKHSLQETLSTIKKSLESMESSRHQFAEKLHSVSQKLSSSKITCIVGKIPRLTQQSF